MRCASPPERGRGAVQRQITQPDLLHEIEPAADFRQDVARDLAFAAARDQAGEEGMGVGDGQRRQLGDRAVAPAHRQRDAVQALAMAYRAGPGFAFVPGVPGGFLAGLFGVEALQLQAGAEAAAAPAVLGVVREQARIGLGEADAARRAGALDREVLLLQIAIQACAQPVQRVHHAQHALPMLQGLPHGIAQRRFVAGVDHHIGHRQFDGVFLIAVQARPGADRDEGAVDAQMGVALAACPFGQVGVVALARRHQRRQHADVLALVFAQQARHDLVGVLRLDRHLAIGAVLGAQLDVQQAQEVMDFRHGGHGRLASAAAGALFDRHGGRDAEDGVHVGLAGRLHDGARIGVERFEVAPLAFVEQDVEGQGRLARPGHARDDRELVARDLDVDVLQVVLARVADLDGLGRLAAPAHQRLQRRAGFLAIGGGRLGQRADRRHGQDAAFVVAQRQAGMRAVIGHQVLRRAHAHHFAAGVAAFRAQVDQPVGGADDVQVVFDHQQRMAGGQQLAEGAHQARHVVEVQAGGGLVEQEQAALLGNLGGGDAAARRLGQVAGQLEPLRLAARQRGHGLAQPHVLQAHVGQRRQAGLHVAQSLEEFQRLADRHFQHLVDRGALAQVLDAHLQHFGAEPLAVAIGAAQVDVGQELHFDVLETGAAAGRAASVAAVEAEGAGGVAALLGQRRLGVQLADRVECADVAGRVGARRLADGRLVHHHHVGDLLGAQQAIERAGRFGRLALLLEQGGVEHVLHQRRFARAGHARDAHQSAQRQFDRHVVQVVRGGAFEDEPRRIVGHRHGPGASTRWRPPR